MEGEEVMPYEELRNEKIRRNMARLKLLGLDGGLVPVVPKATKKKKKKRPVAEIPLRRSKRVMGSKEVDYGIDAAYKALDKLDPEPSSSSPSSSSSSSSRKLRMVSLSPVSNATPSLATTTGRTTTGRTAEEEGGGEDEVGLDEGSKLLKKKVREWLKDEEKAKKKYGDISDWDVSKVTNMRDLFKGAKGFNEDLSNWDTSSVTDMGGMFHGASSFNTDLSRWDTSNVEYMGEMFKKASSFSSDLSTWDVANVDTVAYIFQDAEKVTFNVTKWKLRYNGNNNCRVHARLCERMEKRGECKSKEFPDEVKAFLKKEEQRKNNTKGKKKKKKINKKGARSMGRRGGWGKGVEKTKNN